MNTFGKALFGAVLSLPLMAQAGRADNYIIDPGHTQVTFTVERFGFNYVIGAFDKVTGSMNLDEANPENGQVAISIDTTGLYTGNPERDEIVASRFWLNTEAFPAITFTSTAIEKTGEKTARVTGDLTLLGVTKPITLDATLNKIGTEPAAKRKAAGFSADTRLKRSDYGHTLAMGAVGDDIVIRIEVLGIVE